MFKTIFNIIRLSTKLFRPIPLALNQTSIITNKLCFNFTSSSNPSQVALMEEV